MDKYIWNDEWQVLYMYSVFHIKVSFEGMEIIYELNLTGNFCSNLKNKNKNYVWLICNIEQL